MKEGGGEGEPAGGQEPADSHSGPPPPPRRRPMCRRALSAIPHKLNTDLLCTQAVPETAARSERNEGAAWRFEG